MPLNLCCVICNKELDGYQSCRLSCGHLFHISCLFLSPPDGGSKTCPFCKVSINRLKTSILPCTTKVYSISTFLVRQTPL